MDGPPTHLRIASLDRGVGAIRLIEAVRELRDQGRPGLLSVALFDAADANTAFVRKADEATPTPSSDGLAGIEEALVASRADVLWPGTDGQAIDPSLAALCERLGIVLVGTGSPPFPGFLLVDPKERDRSLEIVVALDGSGAAWAVGCADVTLSWSGRPILVECPPVSFEARQQALWSDEAVALARASGYRGVGSVALRSRPGDERSEVAGFRPGLPSGLLSVVEATSGVDLVKLQLDLALGGELDAAPFPRGHAVAGQVEALDPGNGFAPAPGPLLLLRLPSGPGLRVDSGLAEGDVISAVHGSVPSIASILAWGRDRDEAFTRLRRALGETTVHVRGGATTKTLLADLVDRAEVRAGAAHPGLLGEVGGGTSHRRHADLALLVAAVEEYETEFGAAQASFYEWAARGRPQSDDRNGRTFTLRCAGHGYQVLVERIDRSRYAVVVDGIRAGLRLDRASPFERQVEVGGRRRLAVVVRDGSTITVEIDGAAHRISREEGSVVRSPTPAVVVATRVKPGDEVAMGEPLLVLEAMKMEMSVTAPFAGTVRAVVAGTNSQVDAGAPLVQLARAGAEASEDGGARISLPRDLVPDGQEAADIPGDACSRTLEDLQRLALGYDGRLREAGAVARWDSVCRESPLSRAAIERGEDEFLAIFADVCSLSARGDGGQASPADGDAEQVHAPLEELFAYLRTLDATQETLSPGFVDDLRRALAHHGIDRLERSPQLEEAAFRVFRSQRRVGEQIPGVMAILDRRLARASGVATAGGEPFLRLLDRLIAATEAKHPDVADLAREVRYRCFDQPLLERVRQSVYEDVLDDLATLEADPGAPDRPDRVRRLVECPQPLKGFLIRESKVAEADRRQVMLEILVRRYYRIRKLERVATGVVDGQTVASADYEEQDCRTQLLAVWAEYGELAHAAEMAGWLAVQAPADVEVVLDFYLWSPKRTTDPDATERAVASVLGAASFGRAIRQVVVAVDGPGRGMGPATTEHFTYRPGEQGFREDKAYRGIHPMMAERLQLWRLSNFSIDRLPSVEDVYLFRAVARDNSKDERLFALAEIRDLTPVRDESGRLVHLPLLERVLTETLAGIRLHQSHRPGGRRLLWNRVILYVRPTLELPIDDLFGVVQRLAPMAEGLGLEKVVAQVRMKDSATGSIGDRVVHISNPAGRGLTVRFDEPADRPIRPLSEYMQKVVQTRQRGFTYPYELVKMIAPGRDGVAGDFPPGEFTEYDLDEDARLVPVDRPHGQNAANVMVGVIRTFTAAYPEGMARVVLLGDPSRALGALAEPECRRILAALDLAEELHVPLEWYALSAGAKISMDSGTENMDWIALVLRRLIEFTQGGGEVNVVVAGINVGAQPYWNAEATMLMHTRGILVMTPESAMVLTGKQALDYSGGVSAEDNFGIGGYDRVMGPNGQAQYWAREIEDACQVLLRHYDHTYVLPGERSPRRVATSDSPDRDIRSYPHLAAGSDFTLVGDVFSEEKNPGRKKPFDIRSVMRAVIDQDHPPLERWGGMRDAEIGVVWDAHLGGQPVCLLGIESRPLPRFGPLPADGPDHWTAGTLFPLSSKKVARAVNAASGNRPLVVLANLSGFDGSPDSLRSLQLEYGAEIGRAVVNFDGPIVFCVVSRYHGGAFVVFSAALNANMEVAAVEGSYASVIGGAPAAAVVFAREMDARTKADLRIQSLQAELEGAEGPMKTKLRARLQEISAEVRSEKLGEVAEEFDHVHSVQRAQRVGSVHRIIPAEGLRPYLIEAVERGMDRHLGRVPEEAGLQSSGGRSP